MVFDKKPLLSVFVVSNSLICIIAAIIWIFISSARGSADSFSLGVFYVFTSLLIVLSAVKYLKDTIYCMRISFAIQLLAFFFLLPVVRDYLVIQFLLITPVMIETAVYENPVASRVIVPAALGLLLLYQIESSVLMNTPFQYEHAVIIILTESFISFSLIYMVKYREQLVYEKDEIDNIQGVMKQLTKTNLEYQDYALDAEKSATIQERNRITRDVHDIVGYTLTNTIMMMEAAIDMMQRNPLGVASLIKATRENAQEGLEQTRNALYKLREKRSDNPKGMAAILKMVKLFENATKVSVTLLWNNLSWNFSEQINFIIFHGVQQGLINAFIHGKATHVIVNGKATDAGVDITIKDNGFGCEADEIIEGIGLKGLRERLEKIDGHYEAYTILDGFILTFFIPMEFTEEIPIAELG